MVYILPTSFIHVAIITISSQNGEGQKLTYETSCCDLWGNESPHVLPTLRESVSPPILRYYPSVKLVSGGFERFKRYANRISVDLLTLQEAEKVLDPVTFQERFETWLPSPNLDRTSVRRFRKGHIEQLEGSSQARRFTLVNRTDAIITLEGEGNTRTVLELAFAIDRPALPIAFSGGDSRRVWEKNSDEITKRFGLTPQLRDQLCAPPQSPVEFTRLAKRVAKQVYAAMEKRCLVLMPFGPKHDRFYEKKLYPCIEKANYRPHRIDRDDLSGNILSLFRDGLTKAQAVIVDVTGANPNVMYELGYAHANDIEPMVLVRGSERTNTPLKLPFYLRPEKIVIVGPAMKSGMGWQETVRRYLVQCSMKFRSSNTSRRF